MVVDMLKDMVRRSDGRECCTRSSRLRKFEVRNVEGALELRVRRESRGKNNHGLSSGRRSGGKSTGSRYDTMVVRRKLVHGDMLMSPACYVLRLCLRTYLVTHQAKQDSSVPLVLFRCVLAQE